MFKEENNDLKNLWIGFAVFILYFILSALPYSFIEMFGIKYNSLSTIFKQIYLIIYEISIIALMIFIYRKEWFKDFKNFRNNIFKYFKDYIYYWALAFLLMILSNMIVSRFTIVAVAQNQTEILNELETYPIYILISSVFLAPILEELIFRLSIRKMFAKTKWLFILFSGILFGMLHVMGTTDNLIDFLFIIPYSIPGFIFAYAYTKSNNICVPIMLHFVNNLFIITIQLIK